MVLDITHEGTDIIIIYLFMQQAFSGRDNYNIKIHITAKQNITTKSFRSNFPKSFRSFPKISIDIALNGKSERENFTQNKI